MLASDEASVPRAAILTGARAVANVAPVCRASPDYSTTILQQVMSLSVAESIEKLEGSLKWNLGGLR